MVETRPSDLDGEISIGKINEQEIIGKAKLWYTDYADESRPVAKGYVLFNSEEVPEDLRFIRLTLWETPKFIETTQPAPAQPAQQKL